jgi:hypothetical protein
MMRRSLTSKKQPPKPTLIFLQMIMQAAENVNYDSRNAKIQKRYCLAGEVEGALQVDCSIRYLS